MQETLRLALVQPDLAWQDAAANRDLLTPLLSPLAGSTDLVILPEMFTSAFAIGSGAIAEQAPGPSLDWMREQARQLDAALCGSVAIEDQGRRYNRLYFVTPDGRHWHYDKRHLFRMLGEHKRYAGGNDRLLVEWRGWRILPLVCYDLRFPVWCRNTAEQPWDLMVVVANWPAPRTMHWEALLKARAIENLAFVAGVNRVGVDGNSLAYDGASQAVDPCGEIVAHAGAAATVCRANLSRKTLLDWRETFPAWMDADHFTLHGPEL